MIITKFALFEAAETNVYEVMHGTKRRFERFDLKQAISTPTYGGAPDNGVGIFFTDNEIMAKWFAGLTEYSIDHDRYIDKPGENGRVIHAKVKLENPFIIGGNNEDDDGVQEYFREIEDAGGAQEFREKLIDHEFDGVIIENCTTNYYEGGDYTVFIALNPEQITITDHG